MAKINISKEEKNALIEGIYAGLITQRNLPANIDLAIYQNIIEEVIKGFGSKLDELDPVSKEAVIMSNFTANVSEFTAAKTFHQVNEMQKRVFVGGRKVQFEVFKKDAEKIYSLFNKTWQEVERRTALLQSIGARNWVDIDRDKDLFPLLMYQAINDERVRPEHEELDNIVRPVNDRFWDLYYPPNGWNCRCDVIQLSEGEREVTTKTKGDWEISSVDKVFRNNAAKSGKIFLDNHPYFTVPERYESLKRDNFNLPKF